jgi:outer membrane protein
MTSLKAMSSLIKIKTFIMKNVSLALNIILILAVGILYYLHFSGSGGGSKKSNSLNDIVFVNTDSVWNNYKFVDDKKKELAKYEEDLQNQFETRAMAFEKEYKDYLKAGTSGKLSLDQQKKKEAELGQKQQEIAEYEKSLSGQYLELQQKLNIQIQDSIISYIKKHNQKNNYNYVLGYSRNSGILYAKDNYDITKDILTGLNNEYKTKTK